MGWRGAVIRAIAELITSIVNCSCTVSLSSTESAKTFHEWLLNKYGNFPRKETCNISIDLEKEGTPHQCNS